MTPAVYIRSPHLRSLNPRQDLNQVADLVELCFAQNMDEDGRMYIQQMRRVAQEAHYLYFTSIRLEGYVWEENGKIIGNVTLIPFYWEGKRYYLIANVATHPDYRRQGIGRQLTQAGIMYAQTKGADAVWLQVRDDNPGAEQLYISLGFIERARRTTWICEPGERRLLPKPEGVSISRRSIRDWARQRQWLQQNYPAEIRWNFPLDVDRFRPNPFRDLFRIFYRGPQHWAARKNGHLVGVATWEASHMHADTIWLANDPAMEEVSIRSLLPAVCRNLLGRRAMMVNFAAGQSASAFHDAGFSPRYTLIWMEIPFQKKIS